MWVYIIDEIEVNPTHIANIQNNKESQHIISLVVTCWHTYIVSRIKIQLLLTLTVKIGMFFTFDSLYFGGTRRRSDPRFIHQAKQYMYVHIYVNAFIYLSTNDIFHSRTIWFDIGNRRTLTQQEQCNIVHNVSVGDFFSSCHLCFLLNDDHHIFGTCMITYGIVAYVPYSVHIHTFIHTFFGLESAWCFVAFFSTWCAACTPNAPPVNLTGMVMCVTSESSVFVCLA